MALVALWLGVKLVNDLSFKIKQRDLAERLGINLGDYPPITLFPQNYFLSVLKPQMTKSDVHEIVIGYDLALTCGSGGELYYYYSKDKADAMRFMVFYDFDGKFHKLVGEGDSNWLYDKDCVPGLTDE